MPIFFRFFLKTDKVPVWKGSDPNPNCGLDTDSNWGKFWDLDSNRMYLDPHPWSPLHTHFIFTSGKVTFWIAKMSGVGRFSASFSLSSKRTDTFWIAKMSGVGRFSASFSLSGKRTVPFWVVKRRRVSTTSSYFCAASQLFCFNYFHHHKNQRKKNTKLSFIFKNLLFTFI